MYRYFALGECSPDLEYSIWNKIRSIGGLAGYYHDITNPHLIQNKKSVSHVSTICRSCGAQFDSAVAVGSTIYLIKVKHNRCISTVCTVHIRSACVHIRLSVTFLHSDIKNTFYQFSFQTSKFRFNYKYMFFILFIIRKSKYQKNK